MSCTDSDSHLAIAEANGKFMGAFERGDATALAALHTQDAQVIPPGAGTISGRDAIAAFWRDTMSAGVKRAVLETVELDPQDSTAIEVGKATLYGADGNQIDQTTYLVVWKQEDGQWKIHRDIWNGDTPAGQS